MLTLYISDNVHDTFADNHYISVGTQSYFVGGGSHIAYTGYMCDIMH